MDEIADMPHLVAQAARGEFQPPVYRNAAPAVLYEHAVAFDRGQISDLGAIVSFSGDKTGRCPQDKRIVEGEESRDDVWWGPVNIALPESSFELLKRQALEFLDGCERLYLVDGFAGWDPDHRIKVRIVCSRPYHALFMHNMLIRPTAEELAEFGEPDYVIYNAGQHAADTSIPGVAHETSVALSFEQQEMVILGTEYAGEMKKGVFTIMNYIMPKQGVLSMHCSANEGHNGDVSLFFGLSGTGKTTLSADPHRDLIGDDEHCWMDSGVFNIEGGCYAKCLGLSYEREPEIYGSIRFGAVLENTTIDPASREVDFSDGSLTQNTRVSYPIEFIPHAKTPCIGGHPQNIILLTCDAFGVLPPVSKLTPQQAMYHFISGYTAKIAGTEQGVNEPEATFSACFGAAFLVWHPTKYAEMLAEKMERHQATAWLINTGWTGGAFGVGKRIPLTFTRAIIDAIHTGQLKVASTLTDEVFGLASPTSCPGVPAELLQPINAWADKNAFRKTALKLADLFERNFDKYREGASPDIIAAGPQLASH